MREAPRLVSKAKNKISFRKMRKTEPEEKTGEGLKRTRGKTEEEIEWVGIKRVMRTKKEIIIF